MVEYAKAQPLGNEEELAQWMGYDSVEEMDEDHNLTHEAICEQLGVRSYSLAVRDGLTLNDEQYRIAAMEEQAIIHIQRWLQHMRIMDERT